MLDKNTFGKTPAAMYLVEVLNQRNSKVLNRKVGAKLHAHRALLKQLEDANEAGILSVHNLAAVIHTLRSTVDANHLECLPADAIVGELVHNIIIGELKSLARRAQHGRHLEREQARLMRSNQDREDVRTEWDMESYIREEVHTGTYKLGTTITHQFVPNPVKVKYIGETVTAESLQEKSRQKLARLSKPNTLYPK